VKLGIVSDIHCNVAGLQQALSLMGEIDELIEAKRGLATSIVDRGVETAISELSDDELADLVELRQ
jgi:hypothetical protein